MAAGCNRVKVEWLSASELACFIFKSSTRCIQNLQNWPLIKGGYFFFLLPEGGELVFFPQREGKILFFPQRWEWEEYWTYLTSMSVFGCSPSSFHRPSLAVSLTLQPSLWVLHLLSSAVSSNKASWSAPIPWKCRTVLCELHVPKAPHTWFNMLCKCQYCRWGKTGISWLAFSNPLWSPCQFCIMPRWLFFSLRGLSSLTPVWPEGVRSDLTLEYTSSYCWEQNTGRFQKCAQQPASKLFYFKDRGSPGKKKNPAENLWAQPVNIVLCPSNVLASCFCLKRSFLFPIISKWNINLKIR